MTRWLVTLTLCVVSSLAGADSKVDPFATPHATKQPPAAERAPYSGLGAESVSAEDIAKFVAPPLDAQVSRRIQAMLDVRGSGSGLITARGDRMFYTSAVTGSPQVWRQDGAMKFPVQMTGGEDRTGVVGLAANDSFVVLSRDVGGAERTERGL